MNLINNGKPSISLIIIARNEELGLRSIMPRVPLEAFEDCFAIDGNSVDGTVDLLESFGVRTYPQVEPGLGSAMLEASQHVETDALIFFHPDGNEDPGDLTHMTRLLRGGHEFVVASRMIAGAWNEEDEKFLRWRKYANRAFALLANVFFAHGGNRTTDVTNGFRGITLSAWDRMNLTSRDLTMDYQMIIRALKLGIKITEFPTHEGRRLGGKTNFASIPTGIAELRLLWHEIIMGARTLGERPMRL